LTYVDPSSCAPTLCGRDPAGTDGVVAPPIKSPVGVTFQPGSLVPDARGAPPPRISAERALRRLGESPFRPRTKLRAEEIVVVDDSIAMPFRFAEAFIEGISRTITLFIKIPHYFFTS
jgi:hypothetical protein